MKEVKKIPKVKKPDPTQRIDMSAPAPSPGATADGQMPPNDGNHNHPTQPGAGHPDIKAALKLYTKAVEKAPDKAQPYVDRANAYIANRQLPEALTDFNKALEIEPANTKFLLERGTHYLRLEKPDLAVADFTKAHKIDPTFFKPLMYRGLTHFQNEHFQLALDDFLTLLKNDPTFVDLHLSIAQCYHALGQQEKADQHLKLYRSTTKDPEGQQKANALVEEWKKP